MLAMLLRYQVVAALHLRCLFNPSILIDKAACSCILARRSSAALAFASNQSAQPIYRLCQILARPNKAKYLHWVSFTLLPKLNRIINSFA